jgi:hypothetical protein
MVLLKKVPLKFKQFGYYENLEFIHNVQTTVITLGKI